MGVVGGLVGGSVDVPSLPLATRENKTVVKFVSRKQKPHDQGKILPCKEP